MVFEFDQAKSAANHQKHGIDFDTAQALWKDSRLLSVPVHSFVEIRYQMIGMIGVKHWSAVITYRGEYIRLISVRRARKTEIEYYEKERHEENLNNFGE